MSNDWTKGGVREVLVNPYHYHYLSNRPQCEGQLIEANAKLVTQMRSEGYLRLLLTAPPFVRVSSQSRLECVWIVEEKRRTSVDEIRRLCGISDKVPPR